jgi:hypothetical protein
VLPVLTVEFFKASSTDRWTRASCSLFSRFFASAARSISHSRCACTDICRSTSCLAEARDAPITRAVPRIGRRRRPPNMMRGLKAR